MNFGDSVLKYSKKTGLTLDKAIVSICIQASNSIIKRTPVDTGRAKGNWYASINAISAESSDTRTEGEALSDSISKAKNASGSIFNLTNNLPYIHRLEYGWSKQAPQGMVRVTAAEVDTQLKRL